MKEALGDSVNDVENVVKEGIEWLESHPDASKEEYEEKQKIYEDKIKPIMMKLYENSGMGNQEGPQVSEVD